MMPTLTVIIPTRHRNDLLAICLDRLMPGAQSICPTTYEIIVSDDGIQDTAEEMIRRSYPFVRWVAGPRSGPAANRNNGAMNARGSWLVFTDDDCIPNKDWLDAIMRATDSNCAIEGAIHPVGNFTSDMVECPVNLTGGLFWSANIAIERKLFWEVGGFDVNYPLAAHEDADLRIRLQSLTKIAFVRDAVVMHPIRHVRLWNKISSLTKNSRAWAFHVAKHRELVGYTGDFQFMSKQFITHIRAALRNLLLFRPRSAVASGYVAFVGVPLAAVFIRSQINKMRNRDLAGPVS